MAVLGVWNLAVFAAWVVVPFVGRWRRTGTWKHRLLPGVW